jgi:hypothetical protein
MSSQLSLDIYALVAQIKKGITEIPEAPIGALVVQSACNIDRGKVQLLDFTCEVLSELSQVIRIQ